jgi:hypothetical protein
MARPVVRLAVAGEDSGAKPTDEEVMRRFDEAKRAEQAQRDQEMAEFVEGAIERMTTPEAVDASVEKAAGEAKDRVDAVPTPDVGAKDAAKEELVEVESWYKGKANEGGRTPEEAAAEFKGEGKTLNSIQEEYESTEAALKRAEAAGNQKEVERLTKQAQEYSNMIESQPVAPARPEIAIPEITVPPPPEAVRKQPSPEETLPPTPTVEMAPPPAPSVLEDISEAEVRQRKFDEKSETEQKKQVTRDQTAAIKENAAREAAEPPSQPETAAEVNPDDTIRTREQQEATRAAQQEAIRMADEEMARRRAEEAARVETPPVPAETTPPPATEAAPTPAAAEAVPAPAAERPRAIRPPESGYFSSAVEWASKKTGAGAWLDTLLPRLKSVYHRQFAERRAWMQERATGSLDRAVSKRDEFAAKRADAGWPMKKFYAWRERAWAKSVAKREAIVNKHDLFRTRRIDRHNELQRQVNGRYERELAPYRGVKESLEREQRTVAQVIATLEGRYRTALQALEAAEGRRGGLFGRRGKAAADRIRRCAREIEQRINEQRKNLDRVNRPLAAANAKIEKYEGKRRGVAEVMKFSEMEGLRTVRRARPGALPGRRSFNSYTTEAAPEATVETAGREAEEWVPADFIREWNGNGLVRIEDTAAFERYVAEQRAAAGETGPVRLNRMLELTEGYLTSVGSSRGFARDRRFFLSNIQRTTTP